MMIIKKSIIIMTWSNISKDGKKIAQCIKTSLDNSTNTWTSNLKLVSAFGEQEKISTKIQNQFSELIC